MAKYENKNALKHGAFADAVIIPGEDPQEFQELLAALRDEWNPEGPSENDKVESIAMNMWRKRRFRRYLQKMMAKTVRLETAIEDHDNRDEDRMLDLLEEIESGVFACVTEESILQKLGPIRANQFKKRHPRKNYDSEEAWLDAIRNLICSILEQQPHKSAIERALRPLDEDFADEVFADRELSFEERIDAKIDRDLKLLGQIKSMKAIGIGQRRTTVTPAPLKQIEAPPIQLVGSE
jgi:hypothetical protein